MKELEQTIQTYDAVAAEQIERTRDRSQLRVHLDHFRAELPDPAMVLDVGAGSGADSTELRRRGLDVVSIDLSFGMLTVGRRLFPGTRVQCDMRCLPFNASVMGCWVHASLLHLERSAVTAALGEFRRVMVPPAILHVGVKRGFDQEWDQRYGADHARWFTYWQPDELDRVLREAGFRVIEGSIQTGSDRDWILRLCRGLAPSRGLEQ